MAIEVINRGTSANDGTGDNIREAFRKVNDNFDQVLTNDTTDYTDATTPLAGTEIALVEQGGTFKKVAVSEFGGGGDDTFSLFFAGNNLSFSTLDTWYCATRPFGISTAQSCGTGVTPNSSINTSSAHPIPQGFKIDKIIFGIFSKANNTAISDLEVYVQVGECDYETTANSLSSYQVIAQETISTGTTASTPKFYKELTIADYDINTLDIQSFQFAYREKANTNTISISFLVTFKKA